MKKILIIFVLIAKTAHCQNYPCVPDSLIMNWLNSQNSYFFSPISGINVDLFDIDVDFNFNRYTYRSTCLSSAAKTKILSLLKGEPYDFKKELDENKDHFTNPKSNWAQNRLEFNFKGDTTRLAAKLDSLYRSIRAEQLASKQAEGYSEELIRFVGLIYLYEAIPYLKAELKSPKRYAEIPKQELIKRTLARLGDKYWINFYIKQFSKPSKDYDEFLTKSQAVFYLNDPIFYRTFLRTELKNSTIGHEQFSDYQKSSPMWHKVIFDFVTNYRLEKSYIEKFGKTLYDKYSSKENIYTESIRKGLLEILEACNYDCLVDYSQKVTKY